MSWCTFLWLKTDNAVLLRIRKNNVWKDYKLNLVYKLTMSVVGIILQHPLFIRSEFVFLKPLSLFHLNVTSIYWVFERLFSNGFLLYAISNSRIRSFSSSTYPGVTSEFSTVMTFFYFRLHDYSKIHNESFDLLKKSSFLLLLQHELFIFFPLNFLIWQD
jgi:hypothetical protein